MYRGGAAGWRIRTRPQETLVARIVRARSDLLGSNRGAFVVVEHGGWCQGSGGRLPTSHLSNSAPRTPSCRPCHRAFDSGAGDTTAHARLGPREDTFRVPRPRPDHAACAPARVLFREAHARYLRHEHDPAGDCFGPGSTRAASVARSCASITRPTPGVHPVEPSRGRLRAVPGLPDPEPGQPGDGRRALGHGHRVCLRRR